LLAFYYQGYVSPGGMMLGSNSSLLHIARLPFG